MKPLPLPLYPQECVVVAVVDEAGRAPEPFWKFARREDPFFLQQFSNPGPSSSLTIAVTTALSRRLTLGLTGS